MKILVIGGTRFFGKELVSKLLKQGHDVTVLSRGNQALPHADKISHIRADRDDFKDQLSDLGTHWDVVYDQICYCGNDAAATLKAIKGKADKLIIASTEAVYQNGSNMRETDFDPYSFSYEPGPRSHFSYADGKRHAEAFLYQNSDIPVTAARIPFVLGPDDYTNRLRQIVTAVARQTPIYVPSLKSGISMINAGDLANTLCALKEIDLNGPINIAPKAPITIRALLNKIENVVGKEALLTDSLSDQALSSDFFVNADRSINPDYLTSFGFEIPAIDDWIGSLIKGVGIN